VILVDSPLIGHNESAFAPTTLIGEIADPKALNGPIAFTLRKGQRLKASGMSIKLGGEIPSGLETGDIEIELLTDASGMLYRNPYQDPAQRPENLRSPVYVDLSMDVAMFAKDKNGNAALTQTVLGMQATGTAIATDGALAIETVSSMELGLLGVSKAPSNLVLSLYTTGPGEPEGPADTEAPTLAGSAPGQSEEAPVDGGIELIFNEPIDLERARAGGIKLEDTVSGAIATLIESHGSAVVVRPLQPLAYSRVYRVVMSDVADVAGNKATIPNLSFTTSVLQNSNVPGAIAAIKPGAPCVLSNGTATSPGRCTGGDGGDDLYHPFTLGVDEPIDVGFTVPVRRTSVTRGAACNQGSVRVEEVDASGNCTAVVAGTLMTHDRTIRFVPDVPWEVGKKYKLTLVTGGNGSCDAGEICGPGGAMSFDPLNGTESGDAGGGNLTVIFTGEQSSGGTYMYANASPASDVNGSGFMDSSEQAHDENRAGMRILSTTGAISSASFDDPDCDPSTPEKENCMYLLGAMPTVMEPISSDCNGAGSRCIPLTLSPQAMYATSLAMTAQILVGIGTKTGTNVMRIREPASGPVKGYIVENGAQPKMVTSLELYMDAPDMSVPLSSHDLHSKKLTLNLEGPVTFLPDGRIAISLANTADVPVTVNISGVASGSVKMVLPKGAMHLQLASPALRGVSL